MGSVISPQDLTESGERCLARLNELHGLGLPPAQLVTAVGTVVEMHVGRVLGRLVVLSDVQDTLIGGAMLEEVAKTMNQSWPKRGQWFRKGFDINYMGDQPYQDFDVLVDLRNSVVHGDGGLSDLQAGRTVKALVDMRESFEKKLNVEFWGRAMFGKESSDLAMVIARKFVSDFDKKVIAKYPEARRL